MLRREVSLLYNGRMTWMVWGLAAICLFAEDPSRESVFQTASAALAAGDYPAAERGFKALLSKSPSDIASLGNLGVLYSRTGRSTEAISTYRQALRIHPDDPGILLNLGLVYFKQENFAGALPYFEQLIATNPANSQAVLLLAACRVYTGNPQPAISLLEPLSAATPADQGALYLLAVAYQKNKQPIKAKQTLTQMLQSADPPKAEFLLARAYYDAGLFDEAAEGFRRAIQLDDRLPGVHREFGKVLVSQRNTDQALRELKIALAQNAQDAEAVYFTGALLAQAGRSREAAPYLQQTIRQQPNSWAAYYYLGKARLTENAAPEAVTLLRRAVALNPGDASAYYALGRALQANGKPEEAKQAMAKVRALRADALQVEANALSNAEIIGAGSHSPLPVQ